MKIRWKLMVLLLVIALVPLVVASVLHRLSMRALGARLAADTRRILEQEARSRLRLMVQEYGRLLQRDQQLLELAVRMQAGAAEQRLAGPAPQTADIAFCEDFDAGRVACRPDPNGEFVCIGADGNATPIPINFDRQVCFLAKGVGRAAVADDLARLATMPRAYRLARDTAPRLMHWQYTALESGVHTSFPGHGGYPSDFDPRVRSWYVRPKQKGGLTWQPPNVDVTTRTVMISVSMPVRGPDGRIAGVTGLDVPLERVFSDLKLPEQWSAEEVTLFVYPSGPGDDLPEGKLAIVAEKGHSSAERDWRRELAIRELHAADANGLEALRADAVAGNAGVRLMAYRGKRAMWAYGAAGPQQPFPIVIVPYDQIVAQAAEFERYVLDRAAQGLQTTGIVLVAVIAAVVAAAVFCSRYVTRPVRRLVDAWQRLADGDHGARVDIRTRDELQTLGEAFNDAGPKLAERERMKRSLALAMEIQQHLLPEDAPRLAGFDIAGRSVYCDETGGDYYDFIDLIELGPDRLGIAVGDVTGHGIAAALLMASARGVLRSHAGRHGARLGELFGELNRHLVRDTGEDRFMTLFYGVLNGPERSLVWTSGGHDPALWLRRGTGEIEELPNTGIPLGIVEEAAFGEAGPVTLAPGDVIVIGTDGIWEATNAAGEQFGKQRLREVMAVGAGRSAQEIHAAVVEAVHAFRAGEPQADDITLVVIKAR